MVASGVCVCARAEMKWWRRSWIRDSTFASFSAEFQAFFHDPRGLPRFESNAVMISLSAAPSPLNFSLFARKDEILGLRIRPACPPILERLKSRLIQGNDAAGSSFVCHIATSNSACRESTWEHRAHRSSAFRSLVLQKAMIAGSRLGLGLFWQASKSRVSSSGESALPTSWRSGSTFTFSLRAAQRHFHLRIIRSVPSSMLMVRLEPSLAGVGTGKSQCSQMICHPRV